MCCVCDRALDQLGGLEAVHAPASGRRAGSPRSRRSSSRLSASSPEPASITLQRRAGRAPPRSASRFSGWSSTSRTFARVAGSSRRASRACRTASTSSGAIASSGSTCRARRARDRGARHLRPLGRRPGPARSCSPPRRLTRASPCAPSSFAPVRTHRDQPVARTTSAADSNSTSIDGPASSSTRVVDRQREAVRLDEQVVVGRREVDVAGLDRLLVLDVAHRQPACAAEESRAAPPDPPSGAAVLGDRDRRARSRAGSPPSTRSSAASPPHEAPMTTSSYTPSRSLPNLPVEPLLERPAPRSARSCGVNLIDSLWPSASTPNVSRTVVEQLVHPVLERLAEVDHHVAADDHVELVERAVGDEVVLGEHDPARSSSGLKLRLVARRPCSSARTPPVPPARR